MPAVADAITTSATPGCIPCPGPRRFQHLHSRFRYWQDWLRLLFQVIREGLLVPRWRSPLLLVSCWCLSAAGAEGRQAARGPWKATRAGQPLARRLEPSLTGYVSFDT